MVQETRRQGGGKFKNQTNISGEKKGKECRGEGARHANFFDNASKQAERGCEKTGLRDNCEEKRTT